MLLKCRLGSEDGREEIAHNTKLIKINHHRRLSVRLLYFKEDDFINERKYCESFIALSRMSITLKHKKASRWITINDVLNIGRQLFSVPLTHVQKLREKSAIAVNAWTVVCHRFHWIPASTTH